MSENEFPSRVTLCGDGVYRWSYDMDMYRNPYLRSILLKVMGVLCAVMYVFLLALIAGGGRELTPRTMLLAALPFSGLLLLTLLIYYICAAVMHGTYHLRFEMDEDAVRLVRKASTQRMMNVMADVTTMANMRAGHQLQTAAGSGCTLFQSVRAMTERPEHDAINLRELMGANQLWIPRADYEFVRDFIAQRIPDRAKARGGGWPRRLGVSLLISAALNLAVFIINQVHYNQTCQLRIFREVQGWAHMEQQSVGMVNNMNGFRGGGVLHYDLGLFLLPFAACALIVFLLLTLAARLRRRGE